MDIIPVLDLMQGRVVQGVAGERALYQPIQSVLTPSFEPQAVARALQQETGCRALYIADLDAIQSCGDHRETITRLADDPGIDLWVDAGVSDPSAAVRILEAGAEQVIVGSETLSGLADLRTIRDALPPGRTLFSLDVGTDGVISRCSSLRDLEPLAALDILSQEGLSRFILLTLARVGTGGGPDWTILQRARSAFPHLSLIAGGGVRRPADVRKLSQSGLSGALIATSLHRGWITGKDLQEVTGEG